jgi:hypothetical protein
MIKNLSPNLISAVKDVLKTSSEQIKLQEQKDLDRLNKVKQDTDAIMEKLIGKQHKIDKNKNQKIDAQDFELLRKQKTMKEEDQIDEATKTIDNPKVHDLRHISSHDVRSTDERLYAETQTNDKIKDGDVLRTKHGVGIMNQAWPVHHSGKTPFHVLKPGYSMHTIDGGKYKKSVELANKTHVQVTKERLLNKRKGVAEEVEQVNELSVGTLSNYKKAASKSIAYDVDYRKNPDKYMKRLKAYMTATDKIAKKSAIKEEDQIEEAKRLVSKHGEGVHTAKVYKDTEWGEYQVHYFKHGKHMGEGPVSHHDDKEDAENTAKHEVKRMDASLKEDNDLIGEVKEYVSSYYDQSGSHSHAGVHSAKIYKDDSKSNNKYEVHYYGQKGHLGVTEHDTHDNALYNAKRNVKQMDRSAVPYDHTPDRSDFPRSHAERERWSRQNESFSKVKRASSSLKEGRDTPGNSYNHQCAIHVKHEKLGEGKTLFSQHAEPDSEGNIAWYDVMFNEGIKRVNTDELEIVVSEAHKNHKKM